MRYHYHFFGDGTTCDTVSTSVATVSVQKRQSVAVQFAADAEEGWCWLVHLPGDMNIMSGSCFLMSGDDSLRFGDGLLMFGD